MHCGRFSYDGINRIKIVSKDLSERRNLKKKVKDKKPEDDCPELALKIEKNSKVSIRLGKT